MSSEDVVGWKKGQKEEIKINTYEYGNEMSISRALIYIRFMIFVIIEIVARQPISDRDIF